MVGVLHEICTLHIFVTGFCTSHIVTESEVWKWGGDLGQLRQFLLKKAAAWNFIRTWSWGPFMKAVVFRVVLNLKGRELNCWTEAGEYLMLLLDLKTHLTPSWNSLNCQSGLSKVFFLYMITIVLSLCWRRKQHCAFIQFSFSSWCSCEARSVYSKRSSSAKIIATNPAIVDYRNRACLYHLGHLWIRLSAVHAFYH